VDVRAYLRAPLERVDKLVHDRKCFEQKSYKNTYFMSKYSPSLMVLDNIKHEWAVYPNCCAVSSELEDSLSGHTQTLPEPLVADSN
jgi:hypothetical protein